MCTVCVAYGILSGEIFTLKSKFTKDEYSVRGEEGDEAEGNGRFKIRKNKGEWTDWIETNHLNWVMGDFGFDIKNRCRTERNDKALESVLKNQNGLFWSEPGRLEY